MPGDENTSGTRVLIWVAAAMVAPAVLAPLALGGNAVVRYYSSAGWWIVARDATLIALLVWAFLLESRSRPEWFSWWLLTVASALVVLAFRLSPITGIRFADNLAWGVMIAVVLASPPAREHKRRKRERQTTTPSGSA